MTRDGDTLFGAVIKTCPQHPENSPMMTFVTQPKSMNILDLIRNAKPGSMIDIRSPDNQVDSFRVEDVITAIDEFADAPCGCTFIGICDRHQNTQDSEV